MTTSTSTDKTEIQLARVEVALDATNDKLERLIAVLEREQAVLKAELARLRAECDKLREDAASQRGALRLIQWIGAPAAAAVVVLLAKFGGQ